MAGMPGPYAPLPPSQPYGAPQYPAASYPPPVWVAPPKPRVQLTSRHMTAVGLAVFGIILVLAVLVGPWWSLSLTGDFGGLGLTVTLDFGAFGVSARAFFVSMSFGYDTFPGLARIFQGLVAMLLGALVLAILCPVLAFVRPTARVAPYLGIVSGVLLMVAPIYLMLTLPGADPGGGSTLPPGFGTPSGTLGGFWGSATIDMGGTLLQVAWGAGWGWYLSFVAGAVLIATGAMFLPRKVQAPAQSPGWGSPQGQVSSPGIPPTTPAPVETTSPPVPPPAEPPVPPPG